MCSSISEHVCSSILVPHRFCADTMYSTLFQTASEGCVSLEQHTAHEETKRANIPHNLRPPSEWHSEEQGEIKAARWKARGVVSPLQSCLREDGSLRFRLQAVFICVKEAQSFWTLRIGSLSSVLTMTCTEQAKTIGGVSWVTTSLKMGVGMLKWDALYRRFLFTHFPNQLLAAGMYLCFQNLSYVLFLCWQHYCLNML